jgi:hypothetical protein
MRELKLLTLAAIATLIMLAQPYAGNSAVQVNGSVTVICPFNVYMTLPSTYPRLPSLTANYTVYTTQSCPVENNLAGTFTVRNQTSNAIVYQEPVSVSGNGNSRVNSAVTFSTSNMFNLTYVAYLAFSLSRYNQSTSNTFALVNYANVMIQGFRVPQSVNQGDAITYAFTLHNVGQAASSAISLSLAISGPQSFNFAYGFPALSPGQSSNLSITLSNVTGTVGTYSVKAVASYNSLGLSANSIPVTAAYSVVSQQNFPSGGGGGGSTGGGAGGGSGSALPQVSFTYMPLSVAGQQGQIVQSQISLMNTGSLPQQINLNVSSIYSKFLGLSAYNLNLLPNQSTTVQVYFKPNLTLSTGVYTVPVQISAAYQDGQKANSTQYLTFSIYKQNNTVPTVATQIYLTNSTKLANGVISIIAPKNASINNATLVQWIPGSVAMNASDLNFYGLPTNITVVNGSYKVSSYIGNLPRNQTLYEYYSIRGSVNPQLLLRSQYSIYTLSATQAQDVLKVADISAPTIVSNAIGTITVSMLYTGTSAQPISFTMLPPPQITLANYTQNVTALPNELLVRQFRIIKHPDNGTYLFQLYIKTEGANLSYGIPVVITPNNPQAPGTDLSFLPTYLRIIIFIALVIVILWLLRGRIGRGPKYSPERAGRLIRIREQINRGD